MVSRNCSVLEDFSCFSGIPLNLIREYIAHFPDFTNKEWDDISGGDFKSKVGEFYNRSEYYIYDLLSANACEQDVVKKLNGFNPLILESIRSHPGNRFLEFGGGIGLVCEIVSGFGKMVTYADIPGKVSDFAAWRFRKYGIQADLLINDPQQPLKLSSDYDIIFTDAVLEHVIDPYHTVNELTLHLNEGGLLVLLVDLSGYSDRRHMHQDVDIKKLHRIAKENNLINILGENSFCSIWRKQKRSRGINLFNRVFISFP